MENKNVAKEIIDMIDKKIKYLNQGVFLTDGLYIDGAIEGLKELKKQIKERYGIE